MGALAVMATTTSAGLLRLPSLSRTVYSIVTERVGSSSSGAKVRIPPASTVTPEGPLRIVTLVGSRGPPPKDSSLASRSISTCSPAVTAPWSSFAIGAFALTCTITTASLESFPSASETV